MATMDFFERQDRARRQTSILVLGFAAAVIAVVIAVNLVAWAVAATGLVGTPPSGLRAWLLSPAAAWTAIATLAVILGGSAWRVGQIANGGGGRVATLLGGRIVDPATSERDERELVNVVEEMAIASGMPPPDIYLLDAEDRINAFAAGTVPANAVIAFTAGSLTRLERDELQGVVAHEFSHIANGDMRLNVRLLGLLAGITLIGEAGAAVWRGLFLRRAGMGARAGRGRGRGSGLLAVLAVGAALVVIGWIGVLFGRLIKAAISRQREYLADAAAVQFTRNPDGIGGALIRIGTASGRGMLNARRAEEVSHMGFSGTVGGLNSLTATHPPLEERLRAIGPQYVARYRQAARESGREERADRAAERRQGPTATSGGDTAGAGIPGPLPGAVGDATPGAIGSLLSVAAIGALAGNPHAARLDVARELIARIPPDVHAALHDPSEARCLIWALFLTQPQWVDRLPVGESRSALALREQLEASWGDGRGGLQARIRLPLAELALPALRRLDAQSRRGLIEAADALIGADGRLAIHEFALRALLVHDLFPPQRGAIGRGELAAAPAEVHVVLSVLWHAVDGDEDGRKAAWQAAVGAVAVMSAASEPLARADCALRPFSAALARLSRLQPRARGTLLGACAACVQADGRVAPPEAELLRVIAASLDTPIPPFACN